MNLIKITQRKDQWLSFAITKINPQILQNQETTSSTEQISTAQFFYLTQNTDKIFVLDDQSRKLQSFICKAKRSASNVLSFTLLLLYYL